MKIRFTLSLGPETVSAFGSEHGTTGGQEIAALITEHVREYLDDLRAEAAANAGDDTEEEL